MVGGTIGELGISTLGIAQFIDVGNFEHEADSVVLLDLYSAPAGDPNSVNSLILDPSVTIIDAIGVAVGTTVAHEAGHYLGNYHTENGNAVLNVQDQGGTGIAPLAGADGIFGTADDPVESFGLDSYESTEGFAGVENTATTIEFGASTGTGSGFAISISKFQKPATVSWLPKCIFQIMSSIKLIYCYAVKPAARRIG